MTDVCECILVWVFFFAGFGNVVVEFVTVVSFFESVFFVSVSWVRSGYRLWKSEWRDNLWMGRAARIAEASDVT